MGNDAVWDGTVSFGGAGNDYLAAGTGDDFVDGGDGMDLLFFDGAVSDYAIAGEGAYFVVEHLSTGDSVRFANTENIQFSNTSSLELDDLVAESGYSPGATWSAPIAVTDLII